MRRTNNYVWSTNDVLGQGATGSVYKGRHKKTGEMYAIKVFNSLNYMARPAEVRMREFEVLQKVNHRNIVRLYDVEEELNNKNKVIIMELCAAGSLFTMLDDPENMYGLDEKNFKIVLHDITAGMSHLREKGIVHRDLKPGNIMRSFADDSTPVYKLTDFGAARELEDDEQFVSLYGTEEYLHPDIYERAVLRKPAGKSFTSTVDLWSMGVTFYHVASGNLPYRPYGGARKNKEMMYKITTEKPSGAISGVQHALNGPIEWSKELPKTCRLSEGFKTLFTPVLAGILEGSTHKMSTFEKYFMDISNILRLNIVDVFCVPNGTLYKIYISGDKMFATFQEYVAAQTDIRANSQQYLWEGNLLSIDEFTTVDKYPKTSLEKPFILFSVEPSDFISIHIPHTCKPPKEKQNSATSLENDSNWAKVCASTLFDIKKSVTYLLAVQSNIRLGVKWFTLYLKAFVKTVQLLRSEVHRKVECLRTSLEMFEEHYNRETSLLHLISMVITTPSEIADLKSFFPQITESNKQIRNVKSEFEMLSEKTRSLEEAIIIDDIPTSIFVDDGSKECDRLVEKMTVISDRSREIYRAFKKHKHMKRLNQTEDQIHKFDKQNLLMICTKAVLLFTEQSVPGCKRLHKESQSWFIKMFELRSQLLAVQERLLKLGEDCDNIDHQLSNIQRVYRGKLTAAEGVMRNNASGVTITNGFQYPVENGNSNSWPSSNSLNKLRIDELKQTLQEARDNLNDVKVDVDSNTVLLQNLSNLGAIRGTNGIIHNNTE